MINNHQKHADRRKRVPFYPHGQRITCHHIENFDGGTIRRGLNRAHGRDQLPMGTQTKSETVRLTHQWRGVKYGTKYKLAFGVQKGGITCKAQHENADRHRCLELWSGTAL